METKQRFVVMRLRVANRLDFSDQFGKKKIGVIYFCQNNAGVIEKTPNYFTENTEIIGFKELYANGQIYVPLGLFEEAEVWEEDIDQKSA